MTFTKRSGLTSQTRFDYAALCFQGHQTNVIAVNVFTKSTITTPGNERVLCNSHKKL